MTNTEKKLIKRLKHLLYNTKFFFSRKLLEEKMDNFHPIEFKRISKLLEIYEIADELNISDKELNILFDELKELKYKNTLTYSRRPLGETRDNKRTHNLGNSHHSNACKVRYPREARSKATWKRFYELFPRLAIRDNWDGNISNKMK